MELNKKVIEEIKIAHRQIKAFSIENNMSFDAAAETIARFQDNPSSPEFMPLSQHDRSSLEAAARGDSIEKIAPRMFTELYDWWLDD